MISGQEEVQAVALGPERRTALIIFRFRRVIGCEHCGFYCVWKNGSGQKEEMENKSSDEMTSTVSEVGRNTAQWCVFTVTGGVH